MKTKKGISLIVLVITIIVMIILAAAIIISLNNNGIITQAKNASEKYSKAQIKQEMELTLGEWEIEELTSTLTLEEFLVSRYEDNVQKNDDGTLGVIFGEYIAIVTMDGYLDSVEVNSFPQATDIKVVNSSGEEVSEDSISSGTELYITFSVTMPNGGEVTKVVIGSTQLDKDNIRYAVSKNGYYSFEMTGINSGKEYTRKLEIAVNKYKYKLQKVNYNELANGTKTYTIKGTDSGTGTDATISTEDLDWRLLKITDDGKVLLIPAGLLTSSTVTLTSSENAFMNGPDLLNTICNELYGKGTYAVKARSATVEDFNEFTGYDPNTDSTTLDNSSSFGEYGKYYYYRIWNNGNYSWAWIKDSGDLTWSNNFTTGDLTQSTKTDSGPTKSSGRLFTNSGTIQFVNPEAGQYYADITKQEIHTSFKNTAYEYKLTDYFDLKSLLTDLGVTDGYKIYNSIKDAQFWLASRYTLCSNWNVGFGLRAVNTGKLRNVPMGNCYNVWEGRWGTSEEVVSSYSYKLCPIVELDSSQVDLTYSNKTWEISAKN